MEEKKYKCMFMLLFSRLWEREKWMIITLLFTVVIVIVCKYLEASWFKERLCFTVDCLQNSESIIYTLSISYISGVIVYLLTVVLPETKRSKPILSDIAYLLQDLQSEFTEMELELEIIDTDNIEEAISIEAGTVKKVKRMSECHYSLEHFKHVFDKLKNSSEDLTSKILNHSSVLTQSELKTMVDVRNKKTMKRLKYDFGIESPITECELYDYLKGLVMLSHDIKDLQISIEDRLMKKNTCLKL